MNSFTLTLHRSDAVSNPYSKADKLANAFLIFLCTSLANFLARPIYQNVGDGFTGTPCSLVVVAEELGGLAVGNQQFLTACKTAVL